MKTNIFNFISSFFIALVFLSSAKAEDIVAADISYQHLTGNKYKVTLTVYKECKIVPSDVAAYQVDYASVNCKLQGYFNVLKISNAVVPSCGTQKTICEGGTALGFNKITYSADIDLPGKCEDWKFTWTDNNRSEKITNVPNPIVKSIYIEALVNNKDFVSNNSPVFSSPSAFVTVGADAKIALSGTEKDGDRLEYELVAPSDRSNLLLPYNAPFTFKNPLTATPSLALNSKTGDITFTPTKAGERTVYAVKVTEYRNNKVVGHIVRDLQIAVLDGKNAAPEIGSFNNGKLSEVTFTIGKNNSASISVTDKDANQKLEMTWDKALPVGASFSISNSVSFANGTLSWKPTDADEGTKTFTVTAKDDFCPSAQSTKTFTVKVVKNTSTGVNPKCQFFMAGISINNQCAGFPTKFTSNSFSSSPITSYAWDFGGGLISDKQFPETKVYFPKPGQYTVKLIIKDDKNKCADTAVSIITACETPKVDFTVTSENAFEPGKFRNTLCEGQSLKIEDKTPDVCTVISKKIVLNNKDSVTFLDDFYIFDQIKLAGKQSVKLVITTLGVCQGEAVKEIIIQGKPKIATISSYSYKCNESKDTTIEATIVGGTPFNSTDINKKYRYLWSTSDTKNVEISPSATLRTVTYKFPNLRVEYTGKVTVSDSLLCTADTTFTVKNPISAIFKTSPYCNNKDVINFVTKDIVKSSWGIKSYSWDLGDGTKSALPELKHTYSADSIYPISLKVIDSSLCEITLRDTVYNKLPVKTMSLSKDSICLQGGSADFDGPYFTGKNQGIRYTWTWGSQAASISKKGTYLARESGSNPFKLTYEYNSTALGSCTEFFEKPLTVRELVNIRLDSIQGKCVPDSIRFNITQVGGRDPIKTFDWKFYFLNPVTGARQQVNSSSKEDPFIPFDNNGLHKINVKITDQKGCSNSTISEFDFTPVKMVPSCVTTDGYCQSTALKFFFTCLDSPRPKPNEFAQTASQDWDFGDGSFAQREEPFHPYLTADTFLVKYIGYSDINQKGCKTSATTKLIIYPQPVSKFTNNSECLGTALTFKGDSIPSNFKGDTIRKYKWIFSNTYSKTDSSGSVIDSIFARNTTYLPKYPTQSLLNDTSKLFVSYITTNRYGCEDTLTKEVSVYPKPKADFELSDEDLEAYKSVQFKDKSFSAPPSNLSSWTYEFGDGSKETSESNGNISHTYNAIEIYTVKLTVKNNFGCTDSISKKLDLNAYLVVPNTITPNNDMEGDKFELIYKGIKKVNSYKIFNRWGQVVFDGANDVSAQWDGTFNGVEQPMGVYVYYISATTIYGTEILSSNNLTLIR